MKKDPTAFKRRFEAYKNGKSVKEIYDAGYIKEPVITPDPLYNEYINSLPDNQRLTPESQYRSHRYWELNDKPKNFAEAIGKRMFTFDFSDMGWHANSVALNNKTGEYEFMKPNWHGTKMYEDAWYYSKDGADFRSEYTKKPGVAYDKYVPRFKEGKDPYRYLYDDRSGSWNRITDDENADAFANFVATPNGSRPTFSMYENTPNPTLPVSKNEYVIPDNTLWTRQQVEKANNTRTWRSDAADVAHAIGEGALLSTMFIDPAIEPLVYPTYLVVKNASMNLAENTVGKYIFLQRPGSFTRGIGMGEEGLLDLIETGIVRGNPRGTEVTAKHFSKLFNKNRDNFRDIMESTGIDGIESKWLSRTLTESEFNAIKEAAKPYSTKRMVNDGSTITIKEMSADPLAEYSTYKDYTTAIANDIAKVERMPSRIASGEVKVNTNLRTGPDGTLYGRPIDERFGPNSDYIGDGTPLSYWYTDGRNPITKGYDYAGSKYGVRVNNPEDYVPFMHDMHLHPSFFKSPRLSDPNVEVFKRGPFGITIKIPKYKLQLKTPKNH